RAHDPRRGSLSRGPGGGGPARWTRPGTRAWIGGRVLRRIRTSADPSAGLAGARAAGVSPPRREFAAPPGHFLDRARAPGWSGVDTWRARDDRPLRPGDQQAALSGSARRVAKRDRLERAPGLAGLRHARSEEHTSELQSRFDLVCRLLLEKK